MGRGGKEASVGAPGPTRGTDLGRYDPKKVKTRTFCLKGEKVGWERVRKLTHHLEINKLNAFNFFYIYGKILF